MTLGEWAAWAQVATAVIGIGLSIWAIFLAVGAQSENSRIADLNLQKDLNLSARQEWSSFMEYAADHPKYAMGISEAGLLKLDQTTLEAYKWYVSKMLYHSEMVLQSADPFDWAGSVEGQIDLHRGYLCSQEFRADELSKYTPAVRSLVNARCGTGE
jgi:hypothetical protein